MFIYRAIDSGMVSFHDVKSGNVTLPELIKINHYLDFKADMELTAAEKARKGRRR